MHYLTGSFLEPLHQYTKHRGWQWPWGSVPKPEKRYGIKDVELLWDALLIQSDTQYLGYHSGGFLQPRMWRGLSDGLLFCRSFQDTYRLLLNQQTLLAAPNFLSELEQDNAAVLVVRWEAFSPEINRQLTEYTLRCLVLWGCWLRRPDQWIARIELPWIGHTNPDTSAYRFFRYAVGDNGQLSFCGQRSSLVLDQTTFRQGLRGISQTEMLSRHQTGDIVKKTRQVIEAGLRHGHVTRKIVASKLCISERTLQRQLATCDSSYGELLREVRLHYACRLLRETDRQVLDIALEIGFRDTTNLCRLFRSQLDTTPSLYRENTRYHT
jgi:AraC-like DNA-binding protein